MKILVLTNKMPYPPKDGGSIATLSLILSLHKCGNDIDVLSINTNKHYFPIEEIPTEIKSKIKFYSVDLNTDISFHKATKNLLFSHLPYNAERFISEKFNTKLKDLLKAESYDIVQLEGLYLSPYINTIREYSSAKISLRSHNIEHEIWERAAKNEMDLLKRVYKQILAKRIKNFDEKYRNAIDFLIPITQRDADIYKKNGCNVKIHVSPTGIDKDNKLFSINNSKSEFPGFFHIGALDWQPNQEGLVWFISNVWKKFNMKNPNIKFVVAGRNAPNWIINYLKENQISFIGEVKDAKEFMEKMSVMIVPIRSGSGMRIKIIEGMAAGKTILSTSIGAEGIGVTNNDNIIIADDADDFCNEMIRICNNIELHKKISENARIFIRNNFDNMKIAKNLSDFYTNNLK